MQYNRAHGCVLLWSLPLGGPEEVETHRIEDVAPSGRWSIACTIATPAGRRAMSVTPPLPGPAEAGAALRLDMQRATHLLGRAVRTLPQEAAALVRDDVRPHGAGLSSPGPGLRALLRLGATGLASPALRRHLQRGSCGVAPLRKWQAAQGVAYARARTLVRSLLRPLATRLCLLASELRGLILWFVSLFLGCLVLVGCL